MFDIWDVHGRSIPYTIRPPRPDESVQRVAPSAAPRLRLHSDPSMRRAVAAYEARREQDARRRNPVAEAWMSRPVVTLPAGSDLHAAWSLFRARKFRHIPIVDPRDRNRRKPPVGMLSDRDLLFHLGEQDENPTAQLPDLRVDDLMTTDVLCARPGTSINRVAHVMVEERLGAVPIVDPDQGLIGILTRGDILRLVVELTGTTLPSL